jgi:hypothetical protein
VGILKPRTVVHLVESGGILSGLAKVRLQGQLAEVWIAAEALQK